MSNSRTYRPGRLDDFIGQSRIKPALAVSIEAARIRGKPVPHTIFIGEAGLGKTTLAAIIAAEVGSNFRELSAPSVERLGDLIAVVSGLGDKDVLFIDEIHRLRKDYFEALYTVMEDYKVAIPLKGSNPESGATPIVISVKPFTLVGATTDYGILPEPLRARFGYTFSLQPYTLEESARIIIRAAMLEEIGIDPASVRMMAERCRGVPRIALRLFQTSLDLATVENTEISAEITARSLMLTHIDSMGLTPDDRHYLEVLAEHYCGGPVGPKSIAASSGFGELQVTEAIEPWLLRSGLVMRTRLGRKLTRAGWEHVFTFRPDLNTASPVVKASEEDAVGSELEDMLSSVPD